MRCCVLCAAQLRSCGLTFGSAGSAAAWLTGAVSTSTRPSKNQTRAIGHWFYRLRRRLQSFVDSLIGDRRWPAGVRCRPQWLRGKSTCLKLCVGDGAKNRPLPCASGGMEDVIFAGHRNTAPARNFAEVRVIIDNGERLARPRSRQPIALRHHRTHSRATQDSGV